MTARVCKNCRRLMRSFDNRMFDSVPLKPVTRVPEPGIPIAGVPGVVVPVNVTVYIDLTVVHPVRLSVLAKR
jgi:hypothetical protein